MFTFADVYPLKLKYSPNELLLSLLVVNTKPTPSCGVRELRRHYCGVRGAGDDRWAIWTLESLAESTNRGATRFSVEEGSSSIRENFKIASEANIGKKDTLYPNIYQEEGQDVKLHGVGKFFKELGPFPPRICQTKKGNFRKKNMCRRVIKTTISEGFYWGWSLVWLWYLILLQIWGTWDDTEPITSLVVPSGSTFRLPPRVTE